jgi:hypothetical protein
VRPWRIVLAAAAWLFLAGVVVQVFLAGAGLFELLDWTPHTELGWALGSVPLLLLVMALPARPERRTTWLIVGLTVVAIVQPELAGARRVAPVLAALHPLNALVLFWLAWRVARRLTDEVRLGQRPGEVGPATPPSVTPPAEGAA